MAHEAQRLFLGVLQPIIGAPKPGFVSNIAAIERVSAKCLPRSSMEGIAAPDAGLIVQQFNDCKAAIVLHDHKPVMGCINEAAPKMTGQDLTLM